ncbi:MAG: hypothetical protein O2876_06930 [Proteobacteria bacterium]|nr:hypothetical protein [Pseudomonadota bacterium]
MSGSWDLTDSKVVPFVLQVMSDRTDAEHAEAPTGRIEYLWQIGTASMAAKSHGAAGTTSAQK